LFDGVEHHFQQYFNYMMAVSFIGGGNRMMMISILYYITTRDRRDRDRIRMVVGFTTTYAMSAYQ
jgi:hypothetical protein